MPRMICENCKKVQQVRTFEEEWAFERSLLPGWMGIFAAIFGAFRYKTEVKSAVCNGCNSSQMVLTDSRKGIQLFNELPKEEALALNQYESQEINKGESNAIQFILHWVIVISAVVLIVNFVKF